MTSLAVALLTLTPTLTASPPDGDLLVCRSAPGARIVRTFQVEEESRLVESRQSQDGEEMGGMMPSMDRSSSMARSWLVEDTIEAVDEGRPTAFSRLYGEIEGAFAFEMSMDVPEGMGEGLDESGEADLTSPLTDQVVRFREGDDGLVPSLPEDSDLDAELLEGLESDLSLGFLLPAEAVAEGDDWELDAETLEQLLGLGGDLHMETGDEEEDAVVAMADGLEGAEAADDETEYDGGLTLTHRGRREVDGRSVIVVEIQVDVTTSLSLSPDMLGHADEAPEGMAVPDNLEITIERATKGEGELLFDPAAGLVVSLDLTLEVEETQAHSMTLEIPQIGSIDIESEEVSEERVEVAYTARAK